MKWNANTKEIIAWVLAGLSFVGGWGITIAGFSVDPVGEIHPTVIVIFGQAMVITGAIIGYNLNIKSQGASLYEKLSTVIYDTIERKFREEKERECQGADGQG